MAKRDKGRGGRGRFKSPSDAQGQFLDLVKTHRDLRKGKGKGLIDSTGKSYQRLGNKLREITSGDDVHEQFG